MSLSEYEKGRMDTIAASYAALAATIDGIKSGLHSHTEQEDKDRQRYEQDRTQILLALNSIQQTQGEHKKALELICPHVQDCQARIKSAKFLVGASAVMAAVVSGAVNFGSWLLEHVSLRN